MSTKRKSSVLELLDNELEAETSTNSNASTSSAAPAPDAAPSSDDTAPPPAKKAKTSGSGIKVGKKGVLTNEDGEPLKWYQIKLEGEDEGEVPIYDDCNEVRRKIRALLKEPGFKITKWLKDIGNVNNNSYQRFMKQSGPHGGGENNTYLCGYIYFEKVRIVEGKKKSAKRERNEIERPDGFDPRDSRRKFFYARR